MKHKQLPMPTYSDRKVYRILALPIIAVLFLLGWSMYSTGENKEKRRRKP